MNLPELVGRYMSLRDPQRDALEVLDAISAGIDYREVSLDAVAAAAGEKSRAEKPVEFDTEFPSFCFALATGVGKTRLMGACIYYLWRSKGYRNFFILTPNITIYDKFRAELNPGHPKHVFIGLSDFPQPDVYDGDNYLRFRPEQAMYENSARVFAFNISKIFKRGDTDFRFHQFQETLGGSFASILREMDDLVVIMDESHRYRGKASLDAINHLRPALGLEFTATPLAKQKNVVYRFGLAEAIGKYIKAPTVVTRTNLTTSDKEEIERLKLIDGLILHENKKARYAEYCDANNLPPVKPFVLISTRDTSHAAEVRARIEADGFLEGRYKGKVIEIHSGKTGAESDANVERLLAVEKPTSNVEVVVHVNMLKEGWDVKNLCTIIPLRASISEILTEQTIGRGLRLPFGKLTGDPDLDALEIISHDNYAKLIAQAKDNPLFTFKQIDESDLSPLTTVAVAPVFVDMSEVLERLRKMEVPLFASHFSDAERLNEAVGMLVREDGEAFQRRQTAATGAGEAKESTGQQEVFAGIPETPLEPFDPETRAKKYRDQLSNYSRSIDVPQIFLDTCSDRTIEPFEMQVNVGPLELVDQRILSRELASGVEREGEKMEVIEVDNPRGFLAARLIDAVDEFDVTSDKETALRLADSYIAAMKVAEENLGKIVHLYRDAIVEDMGKQVQAHLQEESEVKMYVRETPVQFREYSKTILRERGLVPYTESVPASEIRRYLFEGFKKTVYAKVPFDSTPEKEFAALLERDDAVLKWIRPPENSISGLQYKGRRYTPDFIVETAERKYIVEVKGNRDLRPSIDDEVRAKAQAAIRWCGYASTLPDSKPWEYRLVPEDVIGATVGLRFVLSQAVRVE